MGSSGTRGESRCRSCLSALAEESRTDGRGYSAQVLVHALVMLI